MLPVILASCAFAAAASQDGLVSTPRVSGQDAHTLLAKLKVSRDLLRSGTYRGLGVES